MTVCGRQGCGIRPDPIPPRLLPHGAGGARGLLTQRTLSARPRPCLALRLSPRRGGPSRRRASRASPGPLVVPLERTRSSLRCPRPSRWRRFPLPAAPSGQPRSSVCAGVESVRSREEKRRPSSPRSRGGVQVPRRVPPARVWRSGLDSDGRRAACHLPTLWGRPSRGRPWRPGPVNFRPVAGREGCVARSRYLWTTASCALASLCALCSRLRPPFAEAVVRLPLPVPQTPTPRRRRPSVLAVARRGSVPGRGRCPPR